MPSMATGDSATVMLRFNAADFDVNIIQKGSIAINCEKGDGKQVFFNVKVVSEDKGSLKVRVQDENTIYGNKNGERPYVSGATVRLTDYNTGALVMSDVTGDDGYVLFEHLNEGYYHLNVTAEKHDSYSQNVLVSPGDVTTHLATISYQAITVNWDVEETEVEDEYEVVTKVTFETYVLVGSDGIIRGAIGGHPDTAADSALSIVVCPLLRGRIPCVVEEVTTLITPGATVDVIVTEYGIAVNPRRPELRERLLAARLPVVEIEWLRDKALSIIGQPAALPFGEKTVGVVLARDGSVQDIIKAIQP